MKKIITIILAISLILSSFSGITIFAEEYKVIFFDDFNDNVLDWTEQWYGTEATETTEKVNGFVDDYLIKYYNYGSSSREFDITFDIYNHNLITDVYTKLGSTNETTYRFNDIVNGTWSIPGTLSADAKCIYQFNGGQ